MVLSQVKGVLSCVQHSAKVPRIPRTALVNADSWSSPQGSLREPLDKDAGAAAAARPAKWCGMEGRRAQVDACVSASTFIITSSNLYLPRSTAMSVEIPFLAADIWSQTFCGVEVADKKKLLDVNV